MRLEVWGRVLSTCGILATAALLSGCFGAPERSVAIADPVDQAPDRVAAGQPPVKTVRRSAPQVADADDSASRGSGIPSPSQIFDFHPRGSKPDTWRQPFVIDPNDGPLSGYVRRMDAELAESNRQAAASATPLRRKTVCPSTGPAGTIAATCGGENQAADRMK